uniref:Alpha-methylacyl-CoA racemase n=1 Tax=Mesocestoides corti TaxID=53468 RepID=A0A5K3FSK7_MESCO
MCLDRLGFPPEVLHKANKRLILTRISGYGQPQENEEIDYYLRPGHDINYLAESGLLWLFTGETSGRPVPPANIIADIAGGAFPAAIGILLALYEREKTGVGKIVDVGIADGVSYMSTYFLASCQVSDQKASNTPFSLMHWSTLAHQCSSFVDGGAPFYRTYETKDKKYVAVGALEPQFYANLLKHLVNYDYFLQCLIISIGKTLIGSFGTRYLLIFVSLAVIIKFLGVCLLIQQFLSC